MRWIQQFSEIDRMLKTTTPPTIPRGLRISRAFGIMRGMCEGEHVIESLVPFEEEYVRLHQALKAAQVVKARASTVSRTISSSTIGEEVINHLLLEKLDDSLSLLDVEGISPGHDDTLAGAAEMLSGRAKRRLPPSGLPRMIQPIGQQTHRLDKVTSPLLFYFCLPN
jgi:hypothetical protein